MYKFKIGTDDFKELIEQNGYFVDKTAMIPAVLNCSKVVLLPRPRRFGKTLAMSMLRYFFEKSPEDRSPLFQNLAVTRDPEAMRHFAQYPVVYLSLKDIRSENWENSYDKLKEKIGDLYLQNQNVLPLLPTIYRNAFEHIMTGNASPAELQSSLKNLISHLYSHHQKPVILLIDEYDSPMIHAWQNGYYPQMANFMREWLGSGLKHENGQALFRAVLTGILRIAKESIFSGLNNLDIFSILSPGPFASCFGFTESEVDCITRNFGVQEIRHTLRDWYNGHTACGIPLYNPWSIINAVQKSPDPLIPYWLNTANPAIIHELMARGGLPIRRDLETLLSGGELRYPIADTIIFDDLAHVPSNMLIWTFLVYSGYLRADDPQPMSENLLRQAYRLTIPNYEIRLAYEQFIQRVFATETMPDGLSDFIDCFKNDDTLTQLEPVLNHLIGALASCHDPAREPEAFYHAFVLGLLASLRDAYAIRSNAEAGYGRADITLIPKIPHHRPLAFIIEFKVAKTLKALKSTAESAMTQITEKNYTAPLLAAGVPPENIRLIALAFAKRRIVVKLARFNG